MTDHMEDHPSQVAPLGGGTEHLLSKIRSEKHLRAGNEHTKEGMPGRLGCFSGSP